MRPARDRRDQTPAHRQPSIRVVPEERAAQLARAAFRTGWRRMVRSFAGAVRVGSER